MMQSLTNQQLTDIADENGTPVYVYDAGQIAARYHKLTDAFKGHPTRFFYACKALTNVNVLKYIKRLGASLDCVSINEVKIGLLAGFGAKDILFTPNCVDFGEIMEGVELGVRINIDSIAMLERFGNHYGGGYPICIRINPHIVAGGNYKISTGHIDSKFGISIHQLRHIERVVKTTGLHVEGLHMHTGSEIKDIDVFLQGLDIMFGVAAQFDELEFIDLGSGFKVPYREDELETDVYALGARVAEATARYEQETKRKVEIWFEPGKYLVSEAGYLVTRVNLIKHTTATVFAGINSGFNQLIRPMFYDSYHRITNISNPEGPNRIYTVVGNICETDTFAWDRVLNEVKEGDYLAFHNAGAYGFEMSSSFNSRLRPAEVLVEDGVPRLIRRRQTLEDLLNGQVL